MSKAVGAASRPKPSFEDVVQHTLVNLETAALQVSARGFVMGWRGG